MGIHGEPIERVEALRGLMDRLCAPDLTLVEAKLLRGRLAELLDRGGRGAAEAAG